MTIDLAARLDRMLRAAGLAIVGVSVGAEDDRTTWKVYPPELQAEAQPHLDAFAIPTAQQIADEELEREIARKFVRALVLGFLELLPEPKPTPAQLLIRIRAIYRSLP